jgi:hypothetical protein
MRRRIAVVGDTLDGGGEIADYQQALGFRARGHKVALIGGMAYCDVCKSTGAIAKAGGPRRPFNRSVREAALDGDIVRCHCATPRQIGAALALETWHDDLVECYTESGTGPECYDEQFTLLARRQRALPATYYTLRYSCGSLVHGVTDSASRTTRHRTHGAQPVALYLGHREG